ncbi:hypothetical protein GWI33_001337 [Rhynchophorus ferrugineus]|uniref:Uncharacterized protein n=1 Tax=Rhynchophorus ferrugineus TaxID=354439 RepID=A0A834MGG0_RHYFE|nr:hypothetical protein GWI33_001337 [Rhynchophorus ferrugineus]
MTLLGRYGRSDRPSVRVLPSSSLPRSLDEGASEMTRRELLQKHPPVREVKCLVKCSPNRALILVDDSCEP